MDPAAVGQHIRNSAFLAVGRGGWTVAAVALADRERDNVIVVVVEGIGGHVQSQLGFRQNTLVVKRSSTLANILIQLQLIMTFFVHDLFGVSLQ